MWHSLRKTGYDVSDTKFGELKSDIFNPRARVTEKQLNKTGEEFK
jgi:hypothetical protein|tara:strand:+ start:201 stop:335 length:135 start_codon:yes stop_codon:yes gene_type:complete